MKVCIVSVALLGACACLAGEWPVLKTYEGENLRRVKMPLGGIGTGTISLSGRGSLVDWEIRNRPAKGFTPRSGNWAPHFAVRWEKPSGEKGARLLEGPLLPEEFEGASGCPVPNHGAPRFGKAVFKAAYPFAQVELRDRAVPVEATLEAMNPLVPGEADLSGIPAALLRWKLRNVSRETLKVSVAGTVLKMDGGELSLTVAEGVGAVTRATDVRGPGWNVSLDRYWRKFLAEGRVADTAKSDSTATKAHPVEQVCVAIALAPGEERKIPFVLAWRYPKRMAWLRYDSKDEADVVGNHYAVSYPTARAAAEHLLAKLSSLEERTARFVNGVLAAKVPDVIKEAALFNLSTLRTETCFRTADGHFYGWEGCFDSTGSCFGSCTHVWGYEHALVDLWPALAKDMVELQFGPALDDRGHMAFRIELPLSRARGPNSTAAADGQMQCVVKAYECWRKTGDDAWLKGLWPKVRRALAFAWTPGGWDADRDGVMEGAQHNTMDVEYYGPNPQMEFLYLAALEAAAAMADACDDRAFASECRGLCTRGKAWTEANLFNGEYYEHRIVPPKGEIARGLRHSSMGAKDLSDPDFQLGAGCLVDQLLGDYAARAVGLPPVADVEHARRTVRTIVERCGRGPDDALFNPMRDYVLAGERSLRMAWYPSDRMPRSPFPYYTETMTGFEYVVAAWQAMDGDFAAAERTVRNIRDRYDGAKRNPFDEAECGHHYARALDAWTVFRAFGGAAPLSANMHLSLRDN